MKTEQAWKALHRVAAAEDGYFTLFYCFDELVALIHAIYTCRI